MPQSMEELQRRIGYAFRNPNYLERALTHSSFANETGAHDHHLRCNERLEFLGDSVLSLIASRYLFSRFPGYKEGELSQLRSRIVCEEALCVYAKEIGLGESLLLGKGERKCGGAQKPAILADAFEAVLAAIYLDAEKNALEQVSDFLMPFLIRAVDEQQGHELLDSKSLLYKFIQQESHEETLNDLEYRTISAVGPDHAKIFEVELYLASNRIGCGKGTTIQQAEQEAAAQALALFGIVKETENQRKPEET